MKKVPSYLKGLAETRARTAADVDRLRALQLEVAEQLRNAELELAAADRLIRKFDERLDPAQIEPIRGRTRYGQRGNLQAAILAYLNEFAGEEVLTQELAIALEAKFGLTFITKQERRRWVKDGLGNRLRDMARQGVIERLHDPEHSSAEGGRWRSKSDAAPSVDRLRGMAEAQGAAVLQSDADHE